jgi:hypothetical protein
VVSITLRVQLVKRLNTISDVLVFFFVFVDNTKVFRQSLRKHVATLMNGVHHLSGCFIIIQPAFDVLIYQMLLASLTITLLRGMPRHRWMVSN